MIAAVSPTGVITADGRTPWHYPADLGRFSRLTMGATLVMGRGTFEGIGSLLAGRTSFVVTRRELDEVRTFATVAGAIGAATGEVWVIGGARIYQDAMRFADHIDLTYVPDDVTGDVLQYFPSIDPTEWTASPRTALVDDPRLQVQTFTRIVENA